LLRDLSGTAKRNARGMARYSGSFSGPPPPASSLAGSFQVDQAAIADGAITLAEIQNVSFTLAVAGFPDRSLTSFDSIGGVQIAVNAQGLPSSQNVLSFLTLRDPYGSGGFIIADVNFNFLGTFPTDAYLASYTNDSGAEVFSVTGGGVGGEENWTVTMTPGPAPVPEPSTLALLSTGAAGLAVWRRRAACARRGCGVAKRYTFTA
jgi:hypothetical protein